jgi:hypothetical protein
MVLTLLPVTSWAGSAVFISDQKAENYLMSTATDRIQMSRCKIISVPDIECITDVHSQHGCITILVTIAASYPQKISVLKFNIGFNLEIIF